MPFGLEGHDWVAHSINAKEKSPMGTNTTIGLDLAKLVFSVCEQDASGRNLQRKDLRRVALAPWLAQLPAGTIVAMEACSGAPHWARCCQAYGLAPKLLAAQFVAPFRTTRTTQTDRTSAEAHAPAPAPGNITLPPLTTAAHTEKP